MKKGFSLIELLVVVAIIAILAAIAGPLYTQYRYKATISRAIVVLSDFALAMKKQYSVGQINTGTTAVSYNGINNIGPLTSVSTVGPDVGYLEWFLPGGNVGGTGIYLGSNEFMVGVRVNNLTGISCPGGAYSGNLGPCSEILMRVTADPTGTFKSLCGGWVTSVYNMPQSYLPLGCTCENISNTSAPNCLSGNS